MSDREMMLVWEAWAKQDGNDGAAGLFRRIYEQLADSDRLDWWESQRTYTLAPVMDAQGWRLHLPDVLRPLNSRSIARCVLPLTKCARVRPSPVLPRTMTETMQHWLMLTSAEAYGHRVYVRADLITSVTEVDTMEYNEQRQPRGVKGSRFVHTIGGNLLNVTESADAIMTALKNVSDAGLSVKRVDAPNTASAVPNGPATTRETR